ncbi:MAG: hypothetical protein IJG37_10540 [Synergistaceae bacterium]|nr:hypothetical protein [Synergistaceae bacterium]MBQ3654418.1 hypothetical protein [Synergistaceae bacterium]
MEKKKWSTFTKIWFGLSIVVGVLGLLGTGTMLVGVIGTKGNPYVNSDMYQQAVMMMVMLFVIMLSGLVSTIWLIKTKTPKALYTVTGISVLSIIIALLNKQVIQAVGGLIGAVILWLLCRKVVFDIE